MADEDQQEMPESIKILNGHPIRINHITECAILRRACVLPDGWSLLNQLAHGRLKISALKYLCDEQFHSLSGVERAGDDLIYGWSDSDTQSPTAAMETDVYKLDRFSGLIHLFAAVGVLKNIWQRESKEDALGAVLCVPDSPGEEAELLAEKAAVVLLPGSVIAEVAWNARYLSKWIIAVFVRRGRVPSQVAEDLVRNLRNRVKTATTPRLLREVQPTEVSESCGVVIFLHGLLSTDAAIFDRFIAALKPDFRFGYLLVGFPHDTFASIVNNAEELLDSIDYLFDGNTKTPLAFVCHSRGGLLARKVAASLYDSGPKRWKKQLRGCVSFGTPHKGTALAEYPCKLLGAGLIGLGAMQLKGFMQASDVLALVEAYSGRVPGVEELKSPHAVPGGNGKTVFLTDLRACERRVAERYKCRLEILAIGGQGPHDSRIGSMAYKVFRGAPNDCAVELSSSSPEQTVDVRPYPVKSDHFSYFEKGHGFGEAISFLEQQMNYRDCKKKVAQSFVELTGSEFLRRPRKIQL